MRKLVVGVSGASGMPLAFALLEALRAQPALETHLVISAGAKRVLLREGATHDIASNDSLLKLESLAHAVYDCEDLGAPPASGSWSCLGMIVCPCSMSSLGAIANGCGNNLLHRAADVNIKEGRKLLLVPRETPFSAIHLGNMLRLSQCGVTLMPPCLAFYNNPRDLPEAIRHFCGRMLDQFGLEHDLCVRWQG